jgi:DNA polymerase elongation subunit (family B)
MAFNISPETYMGNANKNVDFFLNDSTELIKFSQQIKDKKVTTLANGAMFDATYEGILPKIVREVFNMRVEAKNKAKEHAIKVVELKKRVTAGESGLYEEISYNQDREVEYNTLQNALKVKINSMFGFLGNKFSRFYQLDMAEGITLTSQVMLKTGAKLINQVVSKYTKQQKDYLIYGDTDSLYFSMEDVVNKFVPTGTSVETTIEFMDRFYNSKIKQELENAMSSIQELMNSRVKEIEFVRDVISDTSIFIAKKRYIISVWDAEGKRYTEPDLKVMGVESVKTSTPQYCRDKIKELISVMLYNTQNEFHERVVDIKDEFYKLPVEDVAFPRGVSDIDKYVEIKENISIFNNDDDEITVKKGASIAAKASIHHNKLLIEKELLNWYQPITNGDKIKFVYLVQPNPIKNNAIAFDGELIQEFGLHKYVDYDTQWEKALYEPVKKIATIIGWNMEKSYALF